MPNAPLSDWTLYLEIVTGLAAFGLAGLLYAAFRRTLKRASAGGAKIVPAFLKRLSLPAAFILVALLLGSGLVRRGLAVSGRFLEFVHAFLVFFAVVFLVCLIDASLKVWFGRRRVPFPIPGVLHGFILAVIYLALTFMILKGLLGINITPFLATSAILTAVLGLALQGVLGNILAGLSLHFTRSFSRGDWVKIGETEGVIMETNWRETRILDRASNMIVLPNSVVASGTITNFSQPDKRSAITIPLKIGYESAPALVLGTLKEAAREVPDILGVPAPLAYILGYDDLGVSYLLKFWIQDFSRKDPITTEVGRLIWYKLKRQGVEIPIPVSAQLARVLGAVDRSGRKEAEEKGVARTSLDLVNSSFLRRQEGDKAGEAILSDAEAGDLASLIRRVAYTPGEVLFRQGEKGDICYIVARGGVRGRIITEEGGKSYSTEFRIGPGGIVGEMSLFTGMPRTATVTVEEESELLEIGAAAFTEVLSRNPDLAEAIAETVSRRNTDNLESLRKIKELSAGDIEAGSNKKTVLEYLKKLVKLFKKNT
jgi:small-conductance mechanosensitive channel/CRP-like cAMP-binding protein